MKRRETTVAVLVPNWNGAHLIGECLLSLRRQTYRASAVVVVDNGSVDGSPDFIARNFPEVKVVRLPENLGFSAAVNAGIRQLPDHDVALLNNDAEPHPEWLERLVAAAERDPSSAAVASKMVKRGGQGEGLIDSAGNSYSSWGVPFPRGRGESAHSYDQPSDVFAISGGACLIRRDALERIGLFDDSFHMYYEDVDWSFRARLAGFGISYEPAAVVSHLVGASSGGGYDPLIRFHSVKNSWILFVKNLPPSTLLACLPRFLLYQAALLVSSTRKSVIWPHLKALAWVAARLPMFIKARVSVQRGRRIGGRDLKRMLWKGLPPAYRR